MMSRKIVFLSLVPLLFLVTGTAMAQSPIVINPNFS